MPGEFQMGCTIGDTACNEYEKPVHPVRITRAFQVQSHQVTEGQLKEVTWRELIWGKTFTAKVSWDELFEPMAGEFIKSSGDRALEGRTRIPPSGILVLSVGSSFQFLGGGSIRFQSTKHKVQAHRAFNHRRRSVVVIRYRAASDLGSKSERPPQSYRFESGSITHIKKCIVRAHRDRARRVQDSA